MTLTKRKEKRKENLNGFEAFVRHIEKTKIIIISSQIFSIIILHQRKQKPESKRSEGHLSLSSLVSSSLRLVKKKRKDKGEISSNEDDQRK